MNLKELRESRKLTQEEAGLEMNCSQSMISRLERSDDMLMSSLKRYIEAIGGKLEVNIIFKDGTIRELNLE